MLIGWPELLLFIAWVGPFIFILIFAFIEHKWPEGDYLVLGHLAANLAMGVVSTFTSLWFLHSVQNWIADEIGAFDLIDVSSSALPESVHLALCFLAIDFLYYIGHRILHKVPLLWRMHKVHHGVHYVSAFTSVLHHPCEMMVMGAFTFSIYVLVNMRPGAILIYGALNALHSVFVHSDIKLELHTDRFLSYFIFTPRTHKIHHRRDRADENSNFGMIFIIWDYVCGTLHRQGGSAHALGLAQTTHLTWSVKNLLLLPFK